MNINAKTLKNITKLNPKMYKKENTPEPSGIYSKYARLVQHLKIN